MARMLTNLPRFKAAKIDDMKCQRNNTVRQFVDLEARVADDDDDDEEEEGGGMVQGASTLIHIYIILTKILDGFIEDQPVIDAQYVPWRRSNRDEDSNEGGWAGPVIARLQERYVQPRVQQSLAPLECSSAIVSSPDVGKWVRVRNGDYKGDVGYVESTKGSAVTLLLVPRLAPPQPSSVSQKRKRSPRSRSTSKLFNPIDIKQLYGIGPTCETENIYTFDGSRFEHGLIVKTYDLRSVSTSVPCMPISFFSLFLESCHPKLLASKSAFPRPSEWEFHEGDEVYICSSEKRGVITALSLDSVEVELTTGEGAVSVSWLAIRKVVSPGDFVEVTGGVFRGWTGWIKAIDGEVVGIVRDLDSQKPITLDNIEVSQILNVTAVPFVLIFSSGVRCHRQFSNAYLGTLLTWDATSPSE